MRISHRQDVVFLMLLVMAFVTPLQLMAAPALMQTGVPASQAGDDPGTPAQHHCDQVEQAPSQGCCSDGACNDQCPDCGQLVQLALTSVVSGRVTPAIPPEGRVAPSPYRTDPRSLLRPPCRTLTRG
ncbi:MAG: hypothetical protein JSW10_12815 [Pseudomonadota bacterium]|nr:MAG: hypothetical protein JSW10_12815 [Pseudomonadota bacterium]